MGDGSIDIIQDFYYFVAMDVAIRKKIPLFATCRGFQAMSVFFGGELERLPKINNKIYNTWEWVSDKSKRGVFWHIYKQTPKDQRSIVTKHNIFVSERPDFGNMYGHLRLPNIKIPFFYQFDNFMFFSLPGHPEGLMSDRPEGYGPQEIKKWFNRDFNKPYYLNHQSTFGQKILAYIYSIL